MSNDSITSITVPSYPDVTGEFMCMVEEFTTDPNFRQAVTYTRYILQNDPITGDLDESNSNSYTIYADVQIADIENKQVEAGLLSVGDAIIFLPARIQKNTSGTLIDNEFRPQIKDEITCAGISFEIDKIEFTRMGQTEIFAKCFAKRRKNVNPTVIWNNNYSNVYDMGGGYI